MKNQTSAWGHDSLAHDLAIIKANGNRVVFEDIPMGPAGSERPDVYCVSKSFTDPRPTTYEIKVSRADFLQDVKKGKWEVYKPYSQQIFFACPDGLVDKKEIPEGCGLIVRKAKVWRIIKQAPRNNNYSFKNAEVVKLLIATHDGRRCTDGGYRRYLEHRINAVRHIGQLMGADVAAFCNKNFSMREAMESKTKEAKYIIDAVREITGTKCWQGSHTVVEDLKKLMKGVANE